MIKPLTERQVNSGAFDQSPCPTNTKLIICSTPRSGSYLLCRAMTHYGLGVPHEYFNGLNAGVISSRFGLGTINSRDLEADGSARRAYINALLKRRTVNGIFAAKIQGGQFAQYFRNSLDTELFQGAHFIYLYREDLLAQAISFHVSLLTGRWGSDGTAATIPVPQPRFFDNALIESRMQILANQDREWRLFFSRNAIAPLTVSYENIRDDIAGAFQKIVKSLAIHLPSYDYDYVEPLPTEFPPPGEPTKSEIKGRFLQANKQVVTAPRHDIVQPKGRNADAYAGHSGRFSPSYSPE